MADTLSSRRVAAAQAKLAKARETEARYAALAAATTGAEAAPAQEAVPAAEMPPVPEPIQVPPEQVKAVRALIQEPGKLAQSAAVLGDTAATLRAATRPPPAFPGKTAAEITVAPLTTELDAPTLETELAQRQKAIDDIVAEINRTPTRAVDARDILVQKRADAETQLGVTRFLAEAAKYKPTAYRAFSDQEVAKGKELYKKTGDKRLLPIIGQQEEKRGALYQMGKAEAEGIAKQLALPFDEQRLAIGYDRQGRLTVDSAQYEAPLFLKEREERAREMGFSSYATIPQEFEAIFKTSDTPAATAEALQEKITNDATEAVKAKVQKAFQRQRNISLYDPDPESTNLKIASYPPFIREVAAVLAPTAARTQTPTATEFMPERPGSRFLRSMNVVVAPVIARAKVAGESARPSNLLSGISDERAAEITEAPAEQLLGGSMIGISMGLSVLDALSGAPVSQTRRAVLESAATDPSKALGSAASTAGLVVLGDTENIDEATKLVAEIRKDPSAMLLLKDLSQKAYDEATDYKGDPTTRTLIGLGFGATGLVGLDFLMPDPIGGAFALGGKAFSSMATAEKQMARISDVALKASEAEDFGKAMDMVNAESPSAGMLASQMVGVDSMFNADIRGNIAAANRKAADARTKLDEILADAHQKGLIGPDGTLNDIALAQQAAALKEEALTAQLEAATATAVATKDALDNFNTVSKPTLVVIEKNIKQYKAAIETLTKRQTRLDVFLNNNKAIFDQIDVIIDAERAAQEGFVKADDAFKIAQKAKLDNLDALGQAITKAEAEVAAATDDAAKVAAQKKLATAKAALTKATKDTDPLNKAIVKANQERTAAEQALRQAADARGEYLSRSGVESAWKKRVELGKALEGPRTTADALGTALVHQGFDLAKLDDVLPDRVLLDKLASEFKDAAESVKVLKGALKTVGTDELEKALKKALEAETELMKGNRWRESLKKFSALTREGGRQYDSVMSTYRARDAKFADLLGPGVATKPTILKGVERLVGPSKDGFVGRILRGIVTKPDDVARVLLERQDELGELLRKVEDNTRNGRRTELSSREVTLIQQSVPDIAREIDLGVQDDAFQLARGIRIAEEADPKLAPRAVTWDRTWAFGLFPSIHPRAFIPALVSRYRTAAQGMDPIVASTGIQVNEVLSNVVRMVRNMSAQVDDEMMTLVRRADFNNLEPEIVRQVAELVGYDLEGRKLKDELLPGLLSDIRAKMRNEIVVTNAEANLVQASAIVQYMDTTKGLVYPGGKTFINTLSDQTVWQNGRWQMVHDPRLPEMLGLKPAVKKAPGAGPSLPPTPPPTQVVPPTPVPPATPPAPSAADDAATAVDDATEVTDAAGTPPVTPTPPPTPTDRFAAYADTFNSGKYDPNTEIAYLAETLRDRGVAITGDVIKQIEIELQSGKLDAGSYGLGDLADDLARSFGVGKKPAAVPTPTPATPPVVNSAELEKIRNQLAAVQREQSKFKINSPEWRAFQPTRRDLQQRYLAFSRGYGDLEPTISAVTRRKSPLAPEIAQRQNAILANDPLRRMLEALPNGAPLTHALKLVDQNTNEPLLKLIIKRLLDEAGEIDRAKFYTAQQGDRVFDHSLHAGVSLYPRNPGEPIQVILQGSSREGTWKNPKVTAQLVVHEAVHTATQLRLSAAQSARAPAALKAAARELETLYEATKAVAKKQEKAGMYGFTNVDEFVAEGLSDPKFQDFLKTVKVGKTTLWGKFTEAVAKLLGLTEETAFTQLYAQFEKLLEAAPSAEVRAPYWEWLTDGRITPPVGEGARLVDEAQATRAVNTGSPGFRRWFGASQVVDAEGKPLVVYHGTAGDATFFDKLILGASTGAESAKRGFFFTSSPKVASGYGLLSESRPSLRNATYRAAAQSEVLSDDLRQALRDASEKFSDQDTLDAGWYDEAGGGVVGANVMPVYLSLQNPLIMDFKGNKYRERKFADLMTEARAAGHDGVIFRNTFDSAHKDYDEMTDVYAVFEPTQIKSAVANTGDFSRTDRSILAAPLPGIEPRPNAGVIEAPPSGKLDPNSPEVMDPSHHPPADINEIPPPPPGLLPAKLPSAADEAADGLDEADEIADELGDGAGGGDGDGPPDGTGTAPPGPKPIKGEAYVEPTAFRALARAWLPSTPDARLSDEAVAAIERRAYGLLKKNAAENGTFFDFMRDLRQMTHGRPVDVDKAQAGFLRTDDRYARVFGFAGRSVAHAAILRSADDAFRFGTMPLTRDQIDAAVKVLSGKYRDAGDFVAAVRVFNAMGQPATVTSSVQASASGQALRTTVGLLRLSENPAGQDVWTTTFMLKELEDSLPRIIKELDARPNTARFSPSEDVSGFYRQYVSLWKTSAVTGLLLPNPRYYLNNIVGDFSQMWFEMGGYQAAKQTFSNLPVQIPVVGNAAQIMASKLSEKLGGVPVLGSVVNALFNPYLARVWDGSKGTIRLKNGAVLAYDDLRKWLVEDGILDTFVHEELLQSFSEVVPSTWNRTFGGWQKNMEQHANFVQQRQRSGLYLDLIRQGYTRQEAKRLTLNALYDWKNGMAKGELRGLASNIAFYRFWRLALTQFSRGLFEGFTAAKPGEYMLRALRGDTPMARTRNMATLVDRAINPEIQKPEEAPDTTEQQLDDMARAIYPTWMAGRGPTFSYRLSEEARRQFQTTQGRFVSDAAITLPRMTPLDSLAMYSAFVGPMIAGANWAVNGEGEMAPDLLENSARTLAEQFDPMARAAIETFLGLSEETSKGDVRITPAEALILDMNPFSSTPHRDPDTGEYRAGRGEAGLLRASPFLGMQFLRNIDDSLTSNPSAIVAFDRSRQIAQLRAAARLETDPTQRQKFAEAANKLDAQQGDKIEDAAAWFFTRSLGVGPYPYSVDQLNASLGKKVNDDIKAQSDMAKMPEFGGYIYDEGQPTEAETIMREVMGED